MELKSNNLSKADESLREALRQAQPPETIQAVMVLETADDRTGSASKQPEPGEFSSREEYRQAMIDQREAELAEQLGATLQSLRDLGLEVHGGRRGRTVVVKGAARDLLASLDIPAVRQATLDQPFGLSDSSSRRKRRGKT
jgi:hypothetical protein